MCKEKIAVIAGTSEARELIDKLQEEYEVMAFTATELGRDMLKGINCVVSCNRLTLEEFLEKLKPYKIVIDATHPFAVEVTKTVKNACEVLNNTYIRLDRKKEIYDYIKIKYVDSKEEVCKILNKTSEKVLFTTGVNTLEYYAENLKDFKDRAVVRVLDTQESIEKANKYKTNVIFDMPPYSVESNVKIIKENNIDMVVSKDSGVRGGLKEKIIACKLLNINVLLIRGPKDKEEVSCAYSVEEAVKMVENVVYS